MKDIYKYFTGDAPLRDKLIMTILLLSVIGLTTSMFVMVLWKPQPKPAILGGLAIPRQHTPVDTTAKYFDTEYAGDTACFILTSETTIELKCICSCKEYLEKGRGLGDGKSGDAKRSEARRFTIPKH